MDETRTAVKSNIYKDPFTNKQNIGSVEESEENVPSVNYADFPLSYRKGTCAKVFNFMKSITVEPSIIGIMYIIIMYSMSAKQYIYMRLSLEYNLTDSERHHSCNASTANESDPQYLLQQKVSAETSRWTMYTLISTFVFAIFTTILLGSWSDKVGRKVPLLMSHFGFVILILTYVIVVNLNLPVPVLLVGHVICGLFGDLANVLGCSFSYITDITTRHNRTFRMTVLETCIGFGGFVASISGGVWLRGQGFRNPLWFLLAIAIFNFLYILLRLPSTHEGQIFQNLRHLFTKQPFMHMYQVLKPKVDDRNRPLNLILFSVCFLIMAIVFMGVRDVLVIYEIGLPFCWDSALVGVSLALSQLSYFVSMLLVKIFPKYSAELKLVIFGSVLTAASCVVLAFSNSTWMIFLGLILQLCFNLPSPIMRSQGSRLVSKDEVGSVFALLSCAQNVGSLLATVIFNGVFSATVQSVLPGAAFLLGAGLLIVFAPFYWWVYKRTKGILLEQNQDYDPMVNEVH